MSGASFSTLRALDARLVAKGHHPLTPWWAAQLERFYAHPTARTLIARVGRGGAKSHTSVKVSLNETLFGEWKVPPGEVHFWGYCSTNKDEAGQRLRLIEKCLRDLGEPFKRDGDEIVLRSQPVGWRVFAAQIDAVSGFRCGGYSADELAKWLSADRYSNPAEEVIASLGAMTVTHEDPRELLISSPVGHDDYHSRRFDLGDTEHQLVCQASSWVANPATSEAKCRAKQPDPRIFAREYEAIPQAAKLAAFDAEAVERAFRPRDIGATVGNESDGIYRRSGAPPVGIVDASSGKSDAWAYGVCGWRAVEGRTCLVFEHVAGIEGRFWQQRSGDAIVRDVADEFRRRSVQRVCGDQREALMLAAAFGRHGLRFIEHPWTASNKEAAVTRVRRWLADDLLVLPKHERLRAEMLAFEERISSGGGFTFGARGKSHDDFVALLITAAISDAAGQLPGSPMRPVTMADALRARAAREAELRALGVG